MHETCKHTVCKFCNTSYVNINHTNIKNFNSPEVAILPMYMVKHTFQTVKATNSKPTNREQNLVNLKHVTTNLARHHKHSRSSQTHSKHNASLPSKPHTPSYVRKTQQIKTSKPTNFYQQLLCSKQQKHNKPAGRKPSKHKAESPWNTATLTYKVKISVICNAFVFVLYLQYNSCVAIVGGYIYLLTQLFTVQAKWSSLVSCDHADHNLKGTRSWNQSIKLLTHHSWN